jgi:hypothetical protein
MSRNLRSGQIRLDRPGDLVHAFFGFCDIRNFTDLTEVAPDFAPSPAHIPPPSLSPPHLLALAE